MTEAALVVQAGNSEFRTTSVMLPLPGATVVLGVVEKAPPLKEYSQLPFTGAGNADAKLTLTVEPLQTAESTGVGALSTITRLTAVRLVGQLDVPQRHCA